MTTLTAHEPFRVRDHLPMPLDGAVLEGRAAREDHYTIHVTESLAETIERLAGVIGGRRVGVVTDTVVEDLYGAELLRGLRDVCDEVLLHAIPAGEASKSVDGGYGSIRTLQRATGLPALGTEFAAPEVDYVGNARSLGCEAVAVDDAEALAAALRAAREGARTTVVACRVDPRSTTPPAGAFWDLGVAEVSGIVEVGAAATEARAGRERQRFHGWSGG